MESLVTQQAPGFVAQAVMSDGQFITVNLEDYRNKYVVLFFYPMDFTFVCPTELRAFSDANIEFTSLGVQLLACSTDSVYSHLAWINTPKQMGGLGRLNFPLISDFDKKISNCYGVLLPGGMALRGLFVIDKEGIVRHELVNDLPIGRDVKDTLRVIRALQFHEKYGEVCPANWHEGDPGIKV